MAQVPRDTLFEGRPALAISNDKLRLTILKEGGAFVELVLTDDPEKLSPWWNPARAVREGKGKPTPFTGHFVCVDGFGDASKEEHAAGLPTHGEAFRRPWEISSVGHQGSILTLSFTVDLPLTGERLTRTIRMVKGEYAVYVESELESLLGFDRPISWAEHVTIGSPFLEPGVTAVDMSANRARTRPYLARKGGSPHRLPSGKDFTWPMAPALDGSEVDLRRVPLDPNSSDEVAFLMDARHELAFLTALDVRKRLVLGYIWRRNDFPWLQDWESYSSTGELARGLEFAAQPFDMPRRQAVETNSLFDTPTYRWLPAKSKIRTQFLFFYAHTPEDMTRVDDVRLTNGEIVLEDSRAGKKLTLAASLPL